jgi:4-methyl-5(b-hydroxyethyl)-thiazole monophosphate biosynthesis
MPTGTAFLITFLTTSSPGCTIFALEKSTVKLHKKNMEKSYVLLADGFETIEALTPVDIFHRLGLDIVQVSTTGSLQVASSHLVHVTADCTLDQADMSQAALIYLPGGYPGYVNLCNNEQVVDLARRQYQSGRLLAAICGAPMVLQAGGIATGSNITCHHSVKDKINDYNIVPDRVVVDRNLVTGAGAGLSLQLSVTLAAMLLGDDERIDHLYHSLELK